MLSTVQPKVFPCQFSSHQAPDWKAALACVLYRRGNRGTEHWEVLPEAIHRVLKLQTALGLQPQVCGAALFLQLLLFVQ